MLSATLTLISFTFATLLIIDIPAVSLLAQIVSLPLALKMWSVILRNVSLKQMFSELGFSFFYNLTQYRVCTLCVWISVPQLLVYE